MPPKSLAQIAEDTREIRLKMWKLVKDGLSEDEALDSVFTIELDTAENEPKQDKHLTLVSWRDNGLWPPPEAQEPRNDILDSIDLDTMTPIEIWGGADPLPDSGRGGPPGEVTTLSDDIMARITGLIGTTVNAAILDYHNTLKDQLEAEVQRLVKEEVADVTKNLVSTVESDSDLLHPPPRPRTKHGSRKHVVKREKLQGTCDRKLYELFERDRAKRGYNVSQMIDFILYNFYGKPSLSFQKEDST